MACPLNLRPERYAANPRADAEEVAQVQKLLLDQAGLHVVFFSLVSWTLVLLQIIILVIVIVVLLVIVVFIAIVIVMVIVN